MPTPSTPSTPAPPPPGGSGSPNTFINPYLSPYLGLFSGNSAATARPMFSTPALSPQQAGWLARMGSGAKGSQNNGNIPLPIMSTQPPPPPAPPASPSGGLSGAGGGPTGFEGIQQIDPYTGVPTTVLSPIFNRPTSS